MLSRFKSIINKWVAFYLKRHPQDFLNDILEISKSNNSIIEKLFTDERQRLVACAEDYPSIINNGYLHIEKSIELVDFFNLNPSNAVIDIGGADGSIAIKFSNAFEDAQVYSFEPILETFQFLRDNTLKHNRITSINKGLGSKTEKLSIHVAHRKTSSSLFPIEQKINNDFFSENLKEEDVQVVELSTLDTEIPPEIQVNIIKIDVQGYELEVLKGGLKTLERTAIVVLELQNHALYINAPKYYDVDEFLRQNGFQLYNIVPSIRQNKKLCEWDGIYVNNKIGKKYDF